MILVSKIITFMSIIAGVL